MTYSKLSVNENDIMLPSFQLANKLHMIVFET